MEYWGKSARNRLAKVISISREPASTTSGFVTCIKFVSGQTLVDTERILGLKNGELANGAHLLELQELPTADQFELKGYTQTPDGKVWESTSDYPVGRGAPQWRILPSFPLRCRLLATVKPGDRLPQIAA
jgi:hypothetical protein